MTYYIRVSGKTEWGRWNMESKIYDAIVIGAGLGGIRAARQLVESGLKTAIVTSGEFCSGASFYPGTWGLGMVAPRSDEDKQDLLENIDRVGCGLSNLKLSSILVDRVEGEINRLAEMGVRFKTATDPEGVIPCFDKNKRKWFGFDFPSAKTAFSMMLQDPRLRVHTGTTVLEILDQGPGSKGLVCTGRDGSLELLKAKAIVIASGGFTSLYEHSFSMETRSPIVQGLAMKVGCELINLEFIQFIPAYLKPLHKTIFNERVFNHITLCRADGSDLLEGVPNKKEIMKERSAYGPFTTRLDSWIVDVEMIKYYKNNRESVYFQYPEDIDRVDDTLIHNYFNWLKDKKISYADRIHITPFAHACNGGLKIDEGGATTVEGIFACGECTGGVHGADRIGGLSTGNALVFGGIAGENAARYCREQAFKDFEPETELLSDEGRIYNTGNDGIHKADVDSGRLLSNPATGSKGFQEDIMKRLRKLLYEETAIIRTGESIKAALKGVARLKDEIDEASCSFTLTDRVQLETGLGFAKTLLERMDERKESAGCHYRADPFPKLIESSK